MVPRARYCFRITDTGHQVQISHRQISQKRVNVLAISQVNYRYLGSVLCKIEALFARERQLGTQVWHVTVG